MSDNRGQPADGGGDVETTLRETLEAAFAEHTGGDDSGGDAGAAPPSGDAAAAPPIEKPAGQPRTPEGKFAAATPGDAPAPAAAVAAPGAPAEAPADPSAPAPAPAAAEAPTSWKKEVREQWDQIPEGVRSEILRREQAIAKLTNQSDGERRFGKEMADIIRPYDAEIRDAGVPPQFAINVLLQNHRTMRSAPIPERVALARRMIGEYGLDPRQLIDPNAPTDPRMIAMERELSERRARDAIPKEFNSAPLPGVEQNDTVTDDIAAFRTDPAHPHFDTVAATMAALIEAGTASDLSDAYDQAVWANPTLRSTLQAHPAPSPAPSEAQRESPSSKVAAARRASVSVARTSGSAGEPAQTDLRGELRKNLRKFGQFTE